MDQEVERPDIDWAAVRVEYESKRDTVAAIAARYGTSLKTLQNHAFLESWNRRNKLRTVDRSSLIAKLFGLLDRQIMQVELNMTGSGEKEVAVLGKLASTLEKLIDIERATKADRPVEQRRDIEDLRHKLAQRIAQLKRV